MRILRRSDTTSLNGIRQGPRFKGGLHGYSSFGGFSGAKSAPDLSVLAGGHSFGGRMTSTAASESPLDGGCAAWFSSRFLYINQASRKQSERNISMPSPSRCSS